MRLRLLVELRRRGSISAAAEACGMGQPSATKRLQLLEAALGERLVERNGRSSRLTAAGEVVAAHGTRVLDTLDGMDDDLRALRHGESGTLTLAASTTPGSYVLPSILRCFANRHPKVEVDVVIDSSARVVEQMARREASLGLAGSVQFPDGLIAEPFLDDEIVGVTMAGRLDPDDGRIRVDELAGETLLMREAGSSTRAVVESQLARVGYRPEKRWELESNEALKRSVKAGLGIGFVSRLAVADELERGELAEFRFADTEPMRSSVYLLRAGGREPTASEWAFIQTLCDCCRASIASCTAEPKGSAS